ncbi:hypothetical protein [Bradyrhizobium sp.]
MTKPHQKHSGHSNAHSQPHVSRNVTNLAKVMVTEALGVGEPAMTAVGWTLRNRMLRKGTTHVDHAWRGYQHGKAATSIAIKIATGILNGTIPDPTDGAIHFYTPKIMPKEGDATDGYDVSGGLESVDGVKRENKPIKNYRPGFASVYERKYVRDVPEVDFKFYKSLGTHHVR